jgi:sugar/nucleoside kinase (ribokinase family)
MVDDGERHAGRGGYNVGMAASLVCTVGDLVEDIVVHAARPAVRGDDVPAVVSRHRGGSAANVAVAVTRCGGRARFVGHVGDDAVGDRLIAHMNAAGVECPAPRGGRTGTVVVVVEPGGERTMFSDRRTAASLDECDESWLDGAAAIHVPYYSLQEEPLASVALTLLRAARWRDILVSVDSSAVTLLDARFGALVRDVQPDVVLCNAAEAAALRVDEDGVPGARLVVVKQGSAPALLRGEVVADVPACDLDQPVDTTGAGDAFAAGFLVARLAGADPVDAARAGHLAAAHVVRGPGADAWEPTEA